MSQYRIGVVPGPNPRVHRGFGPCTTHAAPTGAAWVVHGAQLISKYICYVLTNQLNTLMDVGSAINRVMLLKYVLASTSNPTVNMWSGGMDHGSHHLCHIGQLS